MYFFTKDKDKPMNIYEVLLIFTCWIIDLIIIRPML